MRATSEVSVGERRIPSWRAEAKSASVARTCQNGAAAAAAQIAAAGRAAIASSAPARAECTTVAATVAANIDRSVMAILLPGHAQKAPLMDQRITRDGGIAVGFCARTS